MPVTLAAVWRIPLALVFVAGLVGCSGKQPKNVWHKIIWKEDTQFATNYSERAFDNVKAGMLRDDVLTLLGNPLRIIVLSGSRHANIVDFEEGKERVRYPDLPENAGAPVTGEIYYYTKHGESGSWYVRAVTFTPEGHVEKTHKSFYTD